MLICPSLSVPCPSCPSRPWPLPPRAAWSAPPPLSVSAPWFLFCRLPVSGWRFPLQPRAEKHRWTWRVGLLVTESPISPQIKSIRTSEADLSPPTVCWHPWFCWGLWQPEPEQRTESSPPLCSPASAWTLQPEERGGGGGNQSQHLRCYITADIYNTGLSDRQCSAPQADTETFKYQVIPGENTVAQESRDV